MPLPARNTDGFVGLDVETCAAVSLPDTGAEAYAEHPLTRVRCAVFGRASSKGDLLDSFVWVPGCALPAWVVRWLESGAPVVAHNASFERAILRHILVPHYGWPMPHAWIDTMHLAALAGLPLGLGPLTRVFSDLPAVKDEEGKKLMLTLHDHKVEPTEEELQQLIEYCRTDVAATLAVLRRLPRATETERRVQEIDQHINDRGIYIDQKLARAIGRAASHYAELLSQDVFAETQDLVTLSSVPALSRWLTERNIQLPLARRKRADGSWHQTPTIGRNTIVEILRRDDLPPEVRRVLNLRIEAGRLTSIAKVERVPKMVSADGRLRGALRYAKAHTGRWSSEGLQVHNLRKPPKEFGIVRPMFLAAIQRRDWVTAELLWPVLDGLSASLRSMLCAPPGYDLIGADFSAIEARVVAWLAGQQDTLDLFASGADVYATDAQQLGSTNRQLGKVARLGLGYGMGPVKFLDTAAAAGVALEPKLAKQVVAQWRKANAHIVALWSSLNDAFSLIMRGEADTMQVGPRLLVTGSQKAIRIVLPSGRALHYRQLFTRDVDRESSYVDDEGVVCDEVRRITELRFFTAGGGGMASELIYGGKLTENVTQAVARDLLAEALLRLSDTVYKVVVHVHDSIAAEVPIGVGSVDEFCSIVRAVPSWAADFPCAVEGYRSPTFKG